MSKFLLVDDDIQLGLRLKDYFSEKSINLEIVTCGNDAVQLLKTFDFDLILLDWMLPDITGLEVCKIYRESGGRTHIIFLTGEGDISNKEQAFLTGGDDYLVKPFDMRELFARIKSVLRRSLDIVTDTITIRGVTLNAEERIITCAEGSIQLTPKECLLLEYLMRHANRPFSAQKLLSNLWPSETDVEVGTVRTSMYYLRQKLASIGRDSLVKSVTKSGYVVEGE